MAKENGKTITNREVKNSAFITYFGDPENASKLYTALGDEEVAPEDITYVTLEGVMFIARKNDLAFTVKNRILVISEHQSTVNENMPLRDLLYLGRTLEKLLDEKMIYRRKQFKIPTPEFYVFYNGDEAYPPEKTLRLSEAFLEKTEHPMVELEVKVININLPSGHRLLKECRPMYEYSWFIQRIKEYLTAGWIRDAAIIQAVRDCQDEGILVEFMKNHGSEVVNMLNTQWDFDDAIAIEREEAFEDGRKAGIELGKMAGIAEGKAAGIAEGKAAGIAEGKAAGIAEGKAAGIAEGKAAGIAEGKAAGIAEGKAAGIAEGKAAGIAEGKAAGIAEGKAAGIAEGKAAGIAEGKAAGIAEGKAAGIAEGKAAGIIEGKNAGIIEGERQVIYTFLERLGEIPEDIRRRIEEEQDEKILKRWYTAAPTIKSFEEFREYMNEI